MDGDQAGSADYVLPAIPFQLPKTRLRIVASYWLIFILGLPLWWITTSIERLALPVERVKSVASATEV
jgi:Phosphatidylinositol-glycan biosynthesis class S protein